MAATGSLLIAAPLLIAAIVTTLRFVGCGIDDSPLPDDGDNGIDDNDGPVSVKTTGSQSSTGTLTASVAFPGHDPKTQEFDTAGTYTYTIPYWCSSIDLILLGAGGGGTYGELSQGVGGASGTWATTTLRRGQEISWTTASIAITVGQGGAGGQGAVPEQAGGDTTITCEMTTQTAPGGSAGASQSGLTGEGPNPSSQTLHGATLTGGADQSTAGAAGNAPGGGGAGGSFLGVGGSGADGAVLVVARPD